MKYKTDENGNAIVQDGKLVMIGDDDKEFAWDAVAGYGELKDTRGEAADWRKKLRQAEGKLEAYQGIEDPDAAREALSQIGKLGDDHKAALEAQKTTIQEGYKKQLGDKDSEIESLRGQIFKFNVTDKFATSEVAKSLVYTPHDAAKIFGSNFEFDDGVLVGKLDGKMIQSKERPGDPADFNEALQAMIDARPDKESILKASGMQGGGSRPGRHGVVRPTSPRDGKKGSDMIRDGLDKRRGRA